MTRRLNIRLVRPAEGDIAETLGLRLDMVPHKSGRVLLTHDATAEDAFCATALHCLRHTARNMAAVTLAQDPEGIHQIRVGLRRLRAALTAFGRDFRTPELEALRDQARGFARRFGETRELDVFALNLLPPVESAARERGGFIALRLAAEELRNESWNASVDLAQSEGFTRFMLDLAAHLNARSWRQGVHPDGQDHFVRPALKLARKVLDKRRGQAIKRARHLDRLDEDERHALRISLKNLRYSSEFYASLFAAKPVAHFLKRLSALQDSLGAVNDIATIDALLERVIESLPTHQTTPELREAAAYVAGWQAAKAQPLWNAAKKRWKRFDETAAFWNG